MRQQGHHMRGRPATPLAPAIAPAPAPAAQEREEYRWVDPAAAAAVVPSAEAGR